MLADVLLLSGLAAIGGVDVDDEVDLDAPTAAAATVDSLFGLNCGGQGVVPLDG
jgi:hypothetical protein